MEERQHRRIHPAGQLDIHHKRGIEVSNTFQDSVRDALVRVTGFIPDENTRELAFAVSLIVTDHLFNLGGLL